MIISGNGDVQIKPVQFRQLKRHAKPVAWDKPQRNKLANRLINGITDAKERITIQLKPAELGRVDIKLDINHDGRMTAVISAERQETLDLLRSDQRNLLHAINEAGMKMSQNNLNFTSSGQNQGNADAQHDQAKGSNQQFSHQANPEDTVTDTNIDPLVGPVIGAGETGELSEDGRLNIRV